MAGSHRIGIGIPGAVEEKLSRLRFGMIVDGMGCDGRDFRVRAASAK